jgi:hypothetical protein
MPLTIEEGVHYCEPEQGDILGEDDVERRSIENLMGSLKSSNQHRDMLKSRVERPNVFKSDILCMVENLVGENTLI